MRSSAAMTSSSTLWTQTIALTTNAVLEDWQPKPIESLQFDDFAILLDTGPEIIVLGSGSKPVIPPRDLVFAMARGGVRFEVMETGAAARTFNVLVSEGRLVAAVLYL